MKKNIMEINRQTYEEFFLLYADGELNPAERRAVEEFVEQNPDLRGEFDLLNESIFEPDQNIVFENKEILYKKEEDRKIVPFRWMKIAVAASLLIAFGVVGWLFKNDNEVVKQQPTAVAQKPAGIEPVIGNEQIASIDDVKTTEAKTNRTEKTAAKNPSTVPSISSVSNKNITKARIKNLKNIDTESAIESRPEISNKLPVPSASDRAIARRLSDEPPIDKAIDVKEPELIYKEENDNIRYVQMENAPSADDDIIYIANTSLPKRTKLRGVFRKASRFLDKVTSLQ